MAIWKPGHTRELELSSGLAEWPGVSVETLGTCFIEVLTPGCLPAHPGGLALCFLLLLPAFSWHGDPMHTPVGLGCGHRPLSCSRV